jgi:hypothetical protein
VAGWEAGLVFPSRALAISKPTLSYCQDRILLSCS